MRAKKMLWLFPLLVMLLANTSHRIVRVGIYDNAPLSFMDEGQPSGFFVDVLEQIAEEERWQLDYYSCEWQACLDALEAGEIDLLGPIAYSEERLKRYDFSSETLLVNWGQVYVQSGDTDVSILDLDGKSIGLLKDDIHSDYFLSIASEFRIDFDEVYLNNYVEILNAIENGDVYGGVVNHFFAMQHARDYGVEETSIIFNPIDVRFAATKGEHTVLLERLDSHVAEMKADNNSLYYVSLANWLHLDYEQNRIAAWVWWLFGAVIVLATFLLAVNRFLRLEVKKRTRAMEESRAELALILNNIPEMVAFVDNNERYLYVDKAYASWYGFTQKEVIGKRVDEILPSKNYLSVKPKIEEVLRSGNEVSYSHQVRRFNGVFADLFVSYIPKKDKNGNVEAFFATVRDITKQKEAETALQEADEKYHQLVDNTFVGIFILQDDKIEFANQGFLLLFGYDDLGQIKGVLFENLIAHKDVKRVLNAGHLKVEAKRSQSQYVFKALRRDGSTFQAEVISQVIQYQGKIALQGVVVDVSEQTQAEERFRRLSEASYEALFISEKGLCIEQNAAAREMFGYTDEEALGRMGTEWIIPEDRDLVMHHMLSGYEEPYHVTALRKDKTTFPVEIIGRMMEYDGRKIRITTMRDITKQLESEEILRQSEERYRNIVINNHAVMFLVDPKTGDIVEANQAASDFYGWTVDQLQRMKITDINILDDDAVYDVMEKAYQKENNHFFFKHRISTGEIRNVEVYSTPLVFFGRELLHSIIHDISARVTAENELIKTKERFERVVAEVPVPIIIATTDGKINFYNEKFIETFGYTLDDISHIEEWWQRVYPDAAYRRRVQDAWEKASNEAYHSRMPITTQTWQIVRKDGETRTVEFDMMPLDDIAVLALNDITERVKAEKALRESKERFEKIIAKAPIPMGILSPRGNTYNERFTEIFGYTDSDIEDWWKVLYPDEEYRAKAKKSWDELKRKVDASDLPVETQTWQIADKAGELRTVEFDMVPLDELSVIAMNDVTEYVRSTAALQENQRKLEEAQKIGKIGHWDWDLATGKCFLSEQIILMLGIDADRAPAAYPNFIELVHPYDRRWVREELLGSVENKTSLDLTHRVLSASGEVLFVRILSRIESAEDDSPIRVIGTMQDVTEEIYVEKVLALRARVAEFSLDHSVDELLRETLDEAEELTNSKIGFYHFVNKNQKEISLQQWSTNTIENYCHVPDLKRHYPTDEAGVWAECIKTKKPAIHNNYPAKQNTQGLPKGHAELMRELVVPVIRQDKVVAVLGVGNKPTIYTQRDLMIVSQIADLCWDIAERKLAEKALDASRSLLLETQQIAKLGTYRLRINEERWTSNAMLDQIFGIDDDYDRSVEGWLELIHPEDQNMMQTYLSEDVLEQAEPFDKHYRVIRQNDLQVRWVHGMGKLEYDQAGNLLSMVGTIQDITERAIAEKKLQTSEQRLRTLINSSPDIICFKDGQGRWLAANEALLKLFQITDVDYLGKTDNDLLANTPLYEKLHPRFEKADQMAWQASKQTRRKETIKTGDKNKVFDVVRVPLFAENGEREALVILGRDITEQIVAEEELRRHARQLEIVNTISATLSTSLTLEDLLMTILQQVVQVIESDSASIFLVEGDALRIVNAVGDAEIFVGHTFKLEDTLMSNIQPEDDVIVFDDVLKEPSYSIWENSPVIRGWMGLPLYARDTLVGYLTFDSVSPSVFTAEDESLAVAFATQVAQALYNAQLHQQVISDANDLEKYIQKRTEELQRFVDLTAGREIRMIELKDMIRELRRQLVQAGHVPVTGDSLDLN